MKIKYITLLGKENRVLVLILSCLFLTLQTVAGVEQNQEYYQLKIYHVSTQDQKEQLELYLKDAYLPALHRAGIKKVGVFYPANSGNSDNITSNDSIVYVFIPFSSIEQFAEIDEVLAKDEKYQQEGGPFIEAAFDMPPFDRYESVLMQAFSGMPLMEVPGFGSEKSSAIYELRSYEAATESLHLNKVKMFNEGEIDIFERLGFNAVFYARVLAGSRMPNLIYMTSFESLESRERHWKSFGEDQAWKDMSSDPQYKNTVSKADIYLLEAASYSDI